MYYTEIMKKKKVKNDFLKLIERIFLVNIPAVFILLFLVFLEKISWLSALISLLCFWVISAIIVILIFKDLDKFINYLNQITTNFSKEQPIFHKGLFSSSRLMNAFQSVSRIWQQQALSDAHILTNLPDPLILLNDKNQAVFINKAAQNLFQGVSLDSLIQTDTFQQIFPKIKEKPQIFEWQTQNRYFQVRLDQLPAPTQKGGVVEVLLHEITDFKIFYQRQNDFFTNASHELKTPLAVISGAVETLQGPAQNDHKAQKEFLSLIATQTHHMTDLVKSLLDLVRQKTLPSQPSQVILSDLLNQLIRDLAPRALKKNQTFVLKAGISPILQADKKELYHLFQNLLDNAIKYGQEGSKIHVALYSKNKNICVDVQNQGPIISKEDLSRLFERFFRSKHAQNNSVEGSGLGLSIAQTLAQRYRGDILVQSTPKKGTIFTVQFPI